MYHILIVEDNSDIAQLYKRALFQYEHTVVDKASDAINILNLKSFDLILLDIHLPGDSGLTVLQHLRVERADKDTRVLVVSADDMYRDKCKPYGIQGWMTKPIEVDRLIEVVNKQFEVAPPHEPDKTQ